MATTIRRLVPRGGWRDVSGALETTAREALQDLEDETLEVSFGVWEGDDGVQFICRVETPPGDPLSSEPPWRWWSSLFRTPEELRAQLAGMVARRLGDREASAANLETGDAAAVAS
jgi:hypothetical protein